MYLTLYWVSGLERDVRNGLLKVTPKLYIVYVIKYEFQPYNVSFGRFILLDSLTSLIWWLENENSV